MVLGFNKWALARPYYDGLTLVADGDHVEKTAAGNPFFTQFSNYQQFWRYHVCPATTRPTGIGMRSGLQPVIATIMQRNYSVFRCLALALDSLSKIQNNDWGAFDSHFDTCIKNAGDALQVATELQHAIAGPQSKLGGVAPLKAQLGATFTLFPDWASHFDHERKLVSAYRNYLTHQGHPATVVEKGTGRRFVLSREAHVRFAPQRDDAFSWSHALNALTTDSSPWVDRETACRDVLHDTLAFLDRCYERLLTHLNPWLTRREYQALWGWADGTDPISTPDSARLIQPTAGSTASFQQPTIGITVSKTVSGWHDTQ